MTRTLLCLLGTTCALIGCQTPNQQQARLEAMERWNAARAGVKARLAADQFAAGRLEAAASELREACQLDPENDELRLMHARVLVSDGAAAAALELLRELETNDDRQAEVFYLRGIINQQHLRWRAAANDYLAAVNSDPTDVTYLAAAVQALLQLGEYESAGDLLAEAQDPLGWTDGFQAAQAEWLEQMGQWQAAAQTWLRIGKPESERTLERHAYALFRAREWPQAALALARVVAADDEVRLAHRLALAEAYLESGAHAQADEQIRIVLDADARNAAALLLRARLLARSGAFERALILAEEAHEIRRNDIYTAELAATLAYRAGDHQRAGELVGEIRERLAPESPVAKRLLEQLKY